MTKLKRASNRRYFAKHWQLYSMLLVMFVSLLIFNYWPMTGLQLAFKDWVIPIGNQAGGVWGSPWATDELGNLDIWKHFKTLFTNPKVYPTFFNTLRISLLRLACGFPMPILLALFLGVMLPITNRLGLTYSVGHSKEALKFNKKQIVTLAVLFALGCGCVAGYLGYYYENNSLTKNYSAEEVVEKNQEMYDIISGRTRENKPCVAIIEYAKKPFLSKEVTYTVAYYAITPADGSAAENFDQTQLWSLKKTPAAKNENLTRLGTAVIVCNDSSGEVLQYTYTPGA